MLKAWLVASMIIGILVLPAVQLRGQTEELRLYANRFLYLSIASFVLFLLLGLIW